MSKVSNGDQPDEGLSVNKELSMHNSQKKRVLDLIKAISSRVQDREGYLNKTKLIKYLYLIDVEYYRRHEQTFTGFDWIFYDFGPWAYEYNDVFNELSTSPDFTIKTGSRSDLDTQFISTSADIELSSIFKDITDESIARTLIDRWADESLNQMLNYVYFHTEPMDRAKRHQRLDFSKVRKMEVIPKCKLTKGNLTKSEKEEIRRRIQKGISLKRTAPENNSFSPPKYDRVYFEGMMILEDESDYS